MIFPYIINAQLSNLQVTQNTNTIVTSSFFMESQRVPRAVLFINAS